MRKWLILIMAMTVMISCGKNGSGTSTATDKSSMDEYISDYFAPEIVGTNILTGEVVKLSDYQGKVVLINFWATWCPPCKAEIPDMIDLYEDYKDDFVIIGIALDDDGVGQTAQEIVTDFAESYGITYPVILGTDDTVWNYGGIASIPTTFVATADGRLLKGSIVGSRTYEQFENLILKLM